jgi:hypothetical protein
MPASYTDANNIYHWTSQLAVINRLSNNATITAGMVVDSRSKLIPASTIKNIPAGNVASTDVQSAINELDTKKLTIHGLEHYAADSGTTNTYAMTLSPVLTSHVVGLPLAFKAGNTNTTASTININGLGPISMKRPDGTALFAGDIVAGEIVTIAYDGTYYQLTHMPASASVGYNIIKDIKSSGTQGGTFTGGSWRTRDLNTLESNSGAIASLVANQFTLNPGTYLVRASVPGGMVNLHQAKLRNITDGTDAIIGTSENALGSGGDTITTRSTICGQITISAQKVFEIQHQCSSSSLDNTGFGSACSFGVSEVYTIVEIWAI